MKRRSDKLRKVASVASVAERRSGQVTGRLQQQLDEQLSRLGELNAFRHNYSNNSLDDVNAVHWKDFQSFRARLDTAVRSQQQLVHDCERNLEAQKRQWLVKRRRLKSLERVIEKNRSQEDKYRERLEQKRLDDMYRGNPARNGED